MRKSVKNSITAREKKIKIKIRFVIIFTKKMVLKKHLTKQQPQKLFATFSYLISRTRRLGGILLEQMPQVLIILGVISSI